MVARCVGNRPVRWQFRRTTVRAVTVLLLSMWCALAGMPIADNVAKASLSSLEASMPSVADLGRTQTLHVEREGPLSFAEAASRISAMPDPEGHLRTWGWSDAYERTFTSSDAGRDDADVVQITFQRFATLGTADDVERYFAGARVAGLPLTIMPPHPNHPDWLRVGGPTTGGHEVTYYALAGNVLARVITTAFGDPTGDASDIMGRTLRKLGGGTATANSTAPVAAPSNPGNTRPTTAELAAQNEFADINAFWSSVYGGQAWFISPKIDFYDVPGSTGCGEVTSELGPFYCYLNSTIYVDQPSLTALSVDDFVLGLAIAYEWGHHLEQLAGYETEPFPMQANQVLNVQMELAADCFAGVWGAGEVLAGQVTREDVVSGLSLMASIGDEAGEPLTAVDAHGTPDMRVTALLLGLEYEDPGRCEDTYLKLQTP